jgi:hypothetical protein
MYWWLNELQTKFDKVSTEMFGKRKYMLQYPLPSPIHPRTLEVSSQSRVRGCIGDGRGYCSIYLRFPNISVETLSNLSLAASSGGGAPSPAT